MTVQRLEDLRRFYDILDLLRKRLGGSGTSNRVPDAWCGHSEVSISFSSPAKCAATAAKDRESCASGRTLWVAPVEPRFDNASTSTAATPAIMAETTGGPYSESMLALHCSMPTTKSTAQPGGKETAHLTTSGRANGLWRCLSARLLARCRSYGWRLRMIQALTVCEASWSATASPCSATSADIRLTRRRRTGRATTASRTGSGGLACGIRIMSKEATRQSSSGSLHPWSAHETGGLTCRRQW